MSLMLTDLEEKYPGMQERVKQRVMEIMSNGQSKYEKIKLAYRELKAIAKEQHVRVWKILKVNITIYRAKSNFEKYSILSTTIFVQTLFCWRPDD